jgi:hypothetical protein
MEYTLAKTEPPSNAVIERAIGIFRAEGLTAF